MGDADGVRAALRQLTADVAPTADPYPRILARAQRIGRFRHTVAAVLALGMVALAVAVVPLAGPATPTPGPTTSDCATRLSTANRTPGATPMPADNLDLTTTANQIERAALAQFPESYTGVAIDTEHDVVTVYRVPGSELDRWLRGAFPSTCLVLADAPRAKAELDSLMDRIAADLQYWRSQGVILIGMTWRYETGIVEFGTTAEDLDLARQLVPARYGPDAPITVVVRQPNSWSDPADTSS
ncbi:hypothetical protein [Dactylosporangium matsuzakiense]|uniref:Uncharacterized protein n=1 Tax=Dactylosporangium matsuzakiense TaxID=53360 RepID=A0A9W6KUS6_9ACTN|nr:hypothetical protein [Dactylosporangium matsuzakiense]GLL06906.1 hypothetical protein GCM10017581_086560 [Dactylosporangium matsuzakiense]